MREKGEVGVVKGRGRGEGKREGRGRGEKGGVEFIIPTYSFHILSLSSEVAFSGLAGPSLTFSSPFPLVFDATCDPVQCYRGLASFQGVGIEGIHFIQRCPHSGCWNRGIPLYTEVSSFQGVEIEEFCCIY